MKQPHFFLTTFLLLGSCQIAQREAQSLGTPLGTIVASQDWAVEMEFGQERVQGTANGGQFLFWKTGDRKLASGVVGTSINQGLIPNIDDFRLEELRSAAVFDAITKADCEVLAYPVFSWEGTSSPISVNYVVHVEGFPGWVRGIQEIPRHNVNGVNYLPGSAPAKTQHHQVPTWIANIYPGSGQAESDQEPVAPNEKRKSNSTKNSWSNWDEPWN